MRTALPLLLALTLACGDDGSGPTGGGGASSSPDGSINCDGEVCDECCVDRACETRDICEQNLEVAIILYCDGPEDCAGGEACCAGIPGGPFPLIAECQTADACAAIESFYLCHQDEDCGVGRACVPGGIEDYVTSCEQDG